MCCVSFIVFLCVEGYAPVVVCCLLFYVCSVLCDLCSVCCGLCVVCCVG